MVHEFVTGGGFPEEESPPPSWIDEGNAMRRALARDLAALPEIDVWMTLDGRLPDEPGPWTTVRVAPGDELATLARLAATADAVLCVAPEPDDMLRTRAEAIERSGGISLGSTAGAIAKVSSKVQLNTFWRERGVSVPSWTRRLRAGQDLPGDISFPAVRKPVVGAGCLETVLIESNEHANNINTVDFATIVQPFVPGIPLSASFLVDRSDHAELIGVGRQNIVMKGQKFRYEGGLVPFEEDVPSRDLHHALEGIDGLRGWVGLDFVWNPETRNVTMLEVNARLTTSFVGWQAWLGTPGVLSARWLRAVAGWDVAEPSRQTRRGPVSFSANGRTTSPFELT